MEMPRTITALADRVRNEAEAYELLEQLRWGTRPVCAHCGTAHVVFIRPMNGESRRTRTGSMSPRRVWKCRECRKQFSALTGTIFHGTKIPVRTCIGAAPPQPSATSVSPSRSTPPKPCAAYSPSTPKTTP